MKKLMFFSIGIITSLVMTAQVQLTETNCSNGIDDGRIVRHKKMTLNW